MVSVTRSHVKVRETRVVGTSFLTESLPVKKRRKDYMEGTIEYSFRMLYVNTPLYAKDKDGS